MASTLTEDDFTAIETRLSEKGINFSTETTAPQQGDKFPVIRGTEGKYVSYSALVDDLALYKAEDKSWKTIVDLINNGTFSSIYPYGTTMYVDFTYNGTTYQYPFQVADSPRSITYPDGSTADRIPLLGLYLCPQQAQFSQYRAFLKCPSGLSAGTYYVTGQAYGTLFTASTTQQFTLTKAVPAGGRIAGFRNGSDATIRVYDAEGKTVLETVTATAGSEGTSLGTMQQATRNGNLASMQEVFYGCNEYHTSAKRQFMTSDKGAGLWWTASDGWDCAPDALSSMGGLLSCFDPEFVATLKTFAVKTAKSTALGAGTNDYDTDYVKCCLPSLEEMYITPQAPAGIEGAYFPLCKDYVGKTSPNGWYSSNANAGLIRYDLVSKSAQWWHTRSADRSYSCYVWYVFTDGNVYSYNAGSAVRVLPLVYI